jgi:hypothetical protein
MSDPHPTTPTRPDKPAKPWPDFSLFAHAAGAWAKKTCGKMYDSSSPSASSGPTAPCILHLLARCNFASPPGVRTTSLGRTR